MSLASQVNLLATRIADECQALWAAINGIPAATQTLTNKTLGAGTVLGTADAEVHTQRAVVVGTHQRDTVIAYSGGKVSTITEKDGAATVKTTTLTYTGDDLTTITVVAGGVTATTTLTYTGSDLTGIDRSIA